MQRYPVNALYKHFPSGALQQNAIVQLVEHKLFKTTENNQSIPANIFHQKSKIDVHQNIGVVRFCVFQLNRMPPYIKDLCEEV